MLSIPRDMSRRFFWKFSIFLILYIFTVVPSRTLLCDGGIVIPTLVRDVAVLTARGTTFGTSFELDGSLLCVYLSARVIGALHYGMSLVAGIRLVLCDRIQHLGAHIEPFCEYMGIGKLHEIWLEVKLLIVLHMICETLMIDNTGLEVFEQKQQVLWGRFKIALPSQASPFGLYQCIVRNRDRIVHIVLLQALVDDTLEPVPLCCYAFDCSNHLCCSKSSELELKKILIDKMETKQFYQKTRGSKRKTVRKRNRFYHSAPSENGQPKSAGQSTEQLSLKDLQDQEFDTGVQMKQAEEEMTVLNVLNESHQGNKNGVLARGPFGANVTRHARALISAMIRGLQTRRIMRSLEKFVGGRLTGVTSAST
ncbi:hypothetical protein Tco_1262733 [Tanacetum coccineum]